MTCATPRTSRLWALTNSTPTTGAQATKKSGRLRVERKRGLEECGPWEIGVSPSGIVVLRWGCSPWRPWERRCWRRWPHHRDQREPSPSTGPGRWPTRSPCSSRPPSPATRHRRAPPGVERLPRQPRGRCRPQHLRPVRRRRRLVGQGGPRQAGAVRRQADQRHRRRQHRRQPARRRALLRRTVHHRHQPDERRLRRGRQPRVRQGFGRAPPHPERWVPSRRRLHGGALCVGWGRHHQHLPRRRLPVPVGQRRAQRQRTDTVPRGRHHADQERQRQEVHDRGHR